jgi:hypothetical protein
MTTGSFQVTGPSLQTFKFEFYLEAFGKLNDQLPSRLPSATDYRESAARLERELQAQPLCAPLLEERGYFPVVFPSTHIRRYGATIHSTFLPLTRERCKAVFGMNHDLVVSDEAVRYLQTRGPNPPLTLHTKSRQDQFLTTLRKTWIVGLLFPWALQGFSIQAARAHVHKLPPKFVLSGPMDLCVSLGMFPSLLVGDHRPKLITAAAEIITDKDPTSLVFSHNGQGIAPELNLATTPPEQAYRGNNRFSCPLLYLDI